MESIGTPNINVQNKFMKLWYKKRKITLKDISINNKKGPREGNEEFMAGKLIAVPTNTSNENSKVE